MKLKCFLYIALLLILAIPVRAQTDFTEIDQIAKSVNYYPTSQLPERITAHCETDLEKVRALYAWMTEHISYDWDLYYDREKLMWTYYDKEKMIDYILDNRKAVCSGYAALFKLYCDKLGIEARVINGLSRQVSNGFEYVYNADHAWNAVRINGKWRLLDVTWAAGSGGVDDFWFLTRPKYFIYTHFPEKGRGTLLKETLNRDSFNNLPLVHSKNFFKYRIREFRNGTLYPNKKSILAFGVGEKIDKNRITFEVTYKKKDPLDDEETLRRSPLLGIRDSKQDTEIRVWENSDKKSEILVYLKSRDIDRISLFIDGEQLVEYRVKFIFK
ncbi:MAG: transglutaminase domain-containing protein [Bacteroidota bacterium]